MTELCNLSGLETPDELLILDEKLDERVSVFHILVKAALKYPFRSLKPYVAGIILAQNFSREMISFSQN